MPESQSHYKYVEGNLTLKWAQSHKHKQTNTHTLSINLTSLVLKLRPCMPCLQKASTLSWRQTAKK